MLQSKKRYDKDDIVTLVLTGGQELLGKFVEESGDYFIVKNSWGDDRWLEEFKGHILVSEAYFRMNTIYILLHKDALPRELKQKLNLEN